MTIEFRVVGSLEKVFCRPGFHAAPLERLTLFQGEAAAFQIAVKGPSEPVDIACRVESPLEAFVTIREVGLVPCLLPAVAEDPFILTAEPGLFPDPLIPHEGAMRAVPHCWRAFWITVQVPEGRIAGPFALAFELSWTPSFTPSNRQAAISRRRVEIMLDVLPLPLAPPELQVAMWFHADCLMARYGVEAWSQRHWRLVENYLRDLADHGGTMLLTPLWTPPLDTDPGGERPTTQLLKIGRSGGDYVFDFTLLERWIDLALSIGYQRFEFSHCCSQWGAERCPKIVIDGENGPEILFNGDTVSDAPEYRDFLSRLLPRLLAFLDRKGIRRQCRFHVSDEPEIQHIGHYAEMARFLAGFIGGDNIFDALSDPAFLREGIGLVPVPGIDHLSSFADESLAERWLYYCGNWRDGVPNRHLGMPSARNRIFGTLLYLGNFDGFLHWGYNFWFSALSRDWHLDPFADPCGGAYFRGGGPFLVYPGQDGNPIGSIHGEVFREALQDLRALRMVEKKIGRAKTVAAINARAGFSLTMNQYPREASWLLSLREWMHDILCPRGECR